ncbi:putative leucine-rich repeat-containing protein DDB_G0290503 isoform X2 [Mya arenaria]|uniref:putative leucine-rich repeat-containing protein DDB_G0290503 isoform X2 n=1 Tax=Mya arenaria TaxID=6604 RepID=UPI0022E582CA|nr:putative leucine-rich repeat-containing protein DDB_G0290503 isoform X2 [Mya arenaria]
MANIHVQCEMCCEEKAVGCCNICGNICESCCVIHKKGRAFQNHILKMYGKDGYNSRSIIYDITEEKCKHHPNERALLFCQIHELMICGRCFRSDHISCGHEVVDLCEEAGHVDYDQFNAMSVALNAIKDDSKRIKEEIDRQKERSNTHAVKCKKELDDLENRLKRKVEHSISSFKEEAQKYHDENIAAFSCISSVCEDKVSWAIKEESQLNEFVNNSLTGRLYLMSRNFDKGISEVKRQMKEAEYKNTFKNVCLKENTAALKCLIEDLTDVCELQEEVDGSDEVTTLSIGNATVENEKTRKELFEELIQAKLDTDKAETARNEFKEQFLQAKRDLENSEKTLKGLEQESLNTKQNMEKSEKTREKLCDELQQVKQKLDHSEKARERFEQDLQKVKQDIDKSEKIRKGIEQELLQVKQGLDNSEKCRQELCDELKEVKQDRDNSEKECTTLQARCTHLKDCIKWTQPTGAVEVKLNLERVYSIKCVFTFPDGIQTEYNPSPGKPYKGGLFIAHLKDDNEGQLVCRMLKARFRRGLMFTVNENGCVELDGLSLFGDSLRVFFLTDDQHIQKVKAELAAKGITETNIDFTEKLKQTFTVDGP